MASTGTTGISVTGTLNTNSGAISGAGEITVADGGTLNTQNGAITDAGSITVGDSGSSTSTLTCGAISDADTILVGTYGELTCGAISTATTITVNKTMTSGAITGAGSITVNKTMNSGDITDAGTINVNENGELICGAISGAGEITVADGGTLNTQTGDISDATTITVDGTLTCGAITNTSGTITVGSTGTLNATGITGGEVSVANKLSVTTSQTDGTISGVALTVNAAGATAPANVAVTADRISNSSIELAVTTALSADSYQYVAANLNNVTFTVNGESVGNNDDIGTTGYIFTTKGGTGAWIVRKAPTTTLYVKSTYTPADDGYGINKFSSVVSALNGVQSDTSAIVIEDTIAAETLSADLTYATFNQNATISGSAPVNVAGAGKNLIIRAEADKTVTIGTAVNAGEANIVLNYGKTGSAIVNAALSGNEIQIDGNATVNAALTASSLLWLRNGYSTTGAATDKIELNANAGASTVLISSGKVETASGKLISANSLIVGTYVPTNNDPDRRDDKSGKAANIVSNGSAWTFNSNMLATGDLEDSFTLNGGSIAFDGGASSILLDKGHDNKTVANDLVLIENANFTLNLNSGATMNAVNISNAGTINVTNSTLNANSVTNSGNGTITVSGTNNTLNIGTLNGIIETVNGATLDASNITGGSITAGNLTFTRANTLNDVTLDATDRTVMVGTGASLTIDAVSSITADTVTFNSSGNTITVSADGVDWRTTQNPDGFSGFRKVIDVNTTDRTLNTGNGGNVLLADGAPANVHLVQLKGWQDDVYITNEDDSTIYIGEEYTNTGEIVNGHLVGYNAFSLSAVQAIDSDTIIVENGTYTGVSQLNGVKTEIQETGDTTLFQRGVYGGIRMLEEQPGEGSAVNPVESDIDLEITGGTFMKLIAGGTLVNLKNADAEYFVSGDTQTVSISGGKFENTVAAGDRLQKGILHRIGDIGMEISGGTFTSFVAGGMMNVITDLQSGHGCIDGNVEMTITGGTFSDNCWIYGGNVSSGKSTISANSTINGSVTITIDANGVADDGIVLSHIIAGSHGSGHIEGKVQADESLLGTKVVFLGDGVDDDKAVVFTDNGELWGSSSSDFVSPVTWKIASSVVKGDRVLSFMGFHGKLDCANIRAFSKIEIKNRTKDKEGADLPAPINSDVILDHENFNMSGIDVWDFDCGSTLSGNFKNGFAGDTLNLWGFSSIATSQILMTDTLNTDERNVFNGFIRSATCNGLAAITMDGTAVSDLAFADNAYTFSAANISYKLSLDTSDTSTSMVLAKL